MHDLLGSEAARRDASARSTARRRNPVAEVRAGHRSFDALSPARSVALSRTGGHVKRSHRSCVEFGGLLACTLQAIRIAESAGLHFLDRSIYRGRLRAPEISRVKKFRSHRVRG